MKDLINYIDRSIQDHLAYFVSDKELWVRLGQKSINLKASHSFLRKGYSITVESPFQKPYFTCSIPPKEAAALYDTVKAAYIKAEEDPEAHKANLIYKDLTEEERVRCIANNLYDEEN